jgi:hypothetical protein
LRITYFFHKPKYTSKKILYFSWVRQAPRSGIVQHGFGVIGADEQILIFSFSIWLFVVVGLTCPDFPYNAKPKTVTGNAARPNNRNSYSFFVFLMSEKADTHTIRLHR